MPNPATDKPYRTGFPPDAPYGDQMTIWRHGKVLGPRIRQFPRDYGHLTRLLNEAYQAGARVMARRA